jgi:3-phenylpropionate/cinnamic acid dioxygenase small subunit
MAAVDEDAVERQQSGSRLMSAPTAAATIAPGTSNCHPGTPLYGEIVGFLYHEAALLDGYRFSDWVALFADDIRYDMPVRTTQFLKVGEGFQEIGFFDENLVSLQTRVKRLETDAAWAETPPSRTRHFVSNVLVRPGAQANEFAVQSNFLVTRTRADRDYQMFTGQRDDTLRRVGGGGFKISRRRILVDQTVITGTNLSILF